MNGEGGGLGAETGGTIRSTLELAVFVCGGETFVDLGTDDGGDLGFGELPAGTLGRAGTDGAALDGFGPSIGTIDGFGIVDRGQRRAQGRGGVPVSNLHGGAERYAEALA